MQWYGGLAFDHHYMDEPWQTFGTARFILPRFELAAKNDKMIFACNILVDQNIEERCRAVLLELDQVNVEVNAIDEPRYEAYDRDDYPDYEHWVKNIDHVQEHIQEKVYDKLVLARKTDFHFKDSLSPWIILRRLMKVAPHSYLFGFQFSAGKAFVGASPERLYRRAGKAIRTEAIAGTRRRGQNPREDTELKKDLVASVKDLREHQYVMEYVENILKENTVSFHCDDTEVLSLQNGHHLITRFQAELKAGIQDELLIRRLHPTPAVGGSPKEVALPEIRHLEVFSRGWYAGPVGYVGLDATEMVVAIRSALVQGKALSVFAGAGIIEGSIPKLEWEEVEHKIANFVKIIDPRRVTAPSSDTT
jgi:menaquinone-specific isochorismate synthase